MVEHGLGRIPPSDSVHIQRYSLAAEQIPASPTPVVLGVSWYRSADAPVKDADGAYWIRTLSNGVRGGHAICLKPPALNDADGAHAHYNQGSEGACVGFAWSRASSLVDRRLFDGFSLYHRAQQIDAFPGEDYSGTEVRAGGAVCQKEGLWRAYKTGRIAKTPGDVWRIGAYFWATSVEQICSCLHSDINLGYVEFLNSWGTGYPHLTRIPLEVLRQLVFGEDGDAAVAVNTARAIGMGA